MGSSEKRSIRTTAKRLPDFFFGNGPRLSTAANSTGGRLETVVVASDESDVVGVFTVRTFLHTDVHVIGHMRPVVQSLHVVVHTSSSSVSGQREQYVRYKMA